MSNDGPKKTKIVSPDEALKRISLLKENMSALSNSKAIQDAGLSADIRISETKDEAYAIKDYEDYMKSKTMQIKVENGKEAVKRVENIMVQLLKDKIIRIFE